MNKDEMIQFVDNNLMNLAYRITEEKSLTTAEMQEVFDYSNELFEMYFEEGLEAEKEERGE